MARARPSWAICASFWACALVKMASVATRPIVVAMPAWIEGGSSPLRIAWVIPSVRRPSSVRVPAMTVPLAGSMTSPTALTATMAPTVILPTLTAAVPMPPFIARPMP